MDYKKIYDELCSSRKNRGLKRESGYEIHHILPRSMGGSNEENNLVKLTYKEHFIAHRLLCKFTEGVDRSRMHAALNIFIRTNKDGKYSRHFLEVRDVNQGLNIMRASIEELPEHYLKCEHAPHDYINRLKTFNIEGVREYIAENIPEKLNPARDMTWVRVFRLLYFQKHCRNQAKFLLVKSHITPKRPFYKCLSLLDELGIIKLEVSKYRNIPYYIEVIGDIPRVLRNVDNLVPKSPYLLLNVELRPKYFDILRMKKDSYRLIPLSLDLSIHPCIEDFAYTTHSRRELLSLLEEHKGSI